MQLSNQLFVDAGIFWLLKEAPESVFVLKPAYGTMFACKTLTMLIKTFPLLKKHSVLVVSRFFNSATGF